jgi:type IV secretory pathway VirB2 component (pilin)
MLMLVVAMLAAGFCLARGAADLRHRRYIWAAVGLLAGAALILTTTIPTHAEKVDLGRVPPR